MSNLYYLHIPKTSGTGISNAVYQTLKQPSNNFVKHNAQPIKEEISSWGNDVFTYDNEQMHCLDFLSGHFAINPLIANNYNLDTFSIIREPVDHFVSLAAYRAMLLNREFNNIFLDDFISGVYDDILCTSIFGSGGNLQTKFLTCRMFDLFENDKILANHWVLSPQTMVFCESDLPKTEKELLARIKSINLFEMNQRPLINEYLINVFKNKWNIVFLGLGLEKANTSIRNGLKPSPKQIAEIADRCNLDMIIYDHVLSNP